MSISNQQEAAASAQRAPIKKKYYPINKRGSARRFIYAP